MACMMLQCGIWHKGMGWYRFHELMRVLYAEYLSGCKWHLLV
jgi:hypothetical protein